MVKKSKNTVPQISTEEDTVLSDIEVSRNQSESSMNQSEISMNQSEISMNQSESSIIQPHVSTSGIKNVTSDNTKVTTPKNEQLTENTDNPVTIYVSKLNKYVETIAKMNSELKQLVVVGKTLEKDFNHIVKLLAKKNKTKSNENRTLTGFAMPTYLTDEMYNFLNEHTELKLEKGEKVLRIVVTRMLNKYIKDHGLRQKTDQRYFVPNEILHRIFKSTETDEVSYFNLQKYIKHHFIKEYKVTK
jgi:hypothetical protein